MPLLYRAPSPETVAAARARLAGLSDPPRAECGTGAGWVPTGDAPAEPAGWAPGPPAGSAEGEDLLFDDLPAGHDARGWVPEANPVAVAAPSPRLLDRSVRELLRGAVPAGLRAARWAPSRRAVVAVALIGLLAAVMATLAAWRARPRPEAIAPRPVTVQAAAASPSPTAHVVVSVAGKVRSPGLVTLPAGARVADAIRAAGGLRPGAKIGLLNLARRLNDGEQILVGVPGMAQPPAAGATSTTGVPGAGPTSLSTATEAELEALPGVGPVLAQRIIDYRTAHGGFRSVDQLRDVSGIGPKKFADLQPVVTP